MGYSRMPACPQAMPACNLFRVLHLASAAIKWRYTAYGLNLLWFSSFVTVHRFRVQLFRLVFAHYLSALICVDKFRLKGRHTGLPLHIYCDKTRLSFLGRVCRLVSLHTGALPHKKKAESCNKRKIGISAFKT